MTSIRTIKAQTTDNLLSKVTRLFNATLDDIIHELLQNARRSGARNVQIKSDLHTATPTLTIADDGEGIQNPEQLLILGGSGWKDGIQHREDPAGMGIFSLSTRGVVVHSQNWRVTLEPGNFSGEEAAHLTPTAPLSGTRLTFPLLPSEADALRRGNTRTIAEAVRYYPLPMFLDGEQLLQEDFLANALYVEEWQGLRIGVYERRHPTLKTEKINFHGLVIGQSFASLKDERGSYSVRIDVADCPSLKLVLPARKEVVQDTFHTTLKKECLRVIYRFVGTLQEHSLSYEHWKEAQELSVPLPEAAPKLRTFTPTRADGWGLMAPFTSVPENGVVVDVAAPAFSEQCFWCAVQAENSPWSATKFFRADSSYAGYSWYQALPRVTSIDFQAVHQGKEVGDKIGDSGIIDTITLKMTIASTSDEQADGPKSYSCEAPVYLVPQDDDYLGEFSEVPVLLARDHGFNVHSLCYFLEAACFEPDEQDDFCSHWMQQELFRDEALERALTLLLSKDQAICTRIKSVVEREIRWLLPTDKVAAVRVASKGVTVKLLPIEPGGKLISNNT